MNVTMQPLHQIKTKEIQAKRGIPASTTAIERKRADKIIFETPHMMRTSVKMHDAQII